MDRDARPRPTEPTARQGGSQPRETFQPVRMPIKSKAQRRKFAEVLLTGIVGSPSAHTRGACATTFYTRQLELERRGVKTRWLKMQPNLGDAPVTL